MLKQNRKYILKILRLFMYIIVKFNICMGGQKLNNLYVFELLLASLGQFP